MDKETHIDALAAAAGAALGLPLGPGGSVLGAVAAPYLAAIGSDLIQRILRRRLDDVHELMVESHVLPDALRDRIGHDEAFLDLYREVVEVAVRSASERKRRALGLLLVKGMLAQEGYDQELELATVRGIDATGEHDLVILEFLAGLPSRAVRNEEGKEVQFTAGEGFFRELGKVKGREVLDFVIENLESAGLIDPTGLRKWGDPYVWSITSLGLAVYKAFRDAGEGAESEEADT